MRLGNSFKRKDCTEEGISLKAEMDEVSPDLRNALTAEDGMFRPGALPKIGTSSAAGNKEILNSIEKAAGFGCVSWGGLTRKCF